MIISKGGDRYYPEPKNWTYKEVKFKPIDRNKYFGMPGRPQFPILKEKLKTKKELAKG